MTVLMLTVEPKYETVSYTKKQYKRHIKETDKFWKKANERLKKGLGGENKK